MAGSSLANSQNSVTSGNICDTLVRYASSNFRNVLNFSEIYGSSLKYVGVIFLKKMWVALAWAKLASIMHCGWLSENYWPKSKDNKQGHKL